jgi:hypothetical protein
MFRRQPVARPEFRIIDLAGDLCGDPAGQMIVAMYLIELQRHDCSRSTETIGPFFPQQATSSFAVCGVFKGGTFGRLCNFTISYPVAGLSGNRDSCANRGRRRFSNP